MVILKSTEIAQKSDGYSKAADLFDKKINKLNADNKTIKERMLKNIRKKESIIEHILLIIDKIKVECGDDDNNDEIVTLMSLKNSLEEDISDYPKSSGTEITPLKKIISSDGVEGITKKIKLLGK